MIHVDYYYLVGLYVIVLMAAHSWFPWCCCDDGGTALCDSCSVDADAATITISGLVNGGCPRCDRVNGTYVVRRSAYVPCEWSETYATPCGMLSIRCVAEPNVIGSPHHGWALTLDMQAVGIHDHVIFAADSGADAPYDCTAEYAADYQYAAAQSGCMGWSAAGAVVIN
ncbi:MAG: hypothetical protein GXY58_19370 [Planctomycetaceae bacterium]|nr:hypothetical protein [Planctomycetaceae bacterium]